MQQEFGMLGNFLPRKLEQIPGSHKAAVPVVAALGGVKIPAADSLSITGQCQVEQFKLNSSGQFDEIAIDVVRHENGGQRVVSPLIVAIEAPGLQRIEPNSLGPEQRVCPFRQDGRISATDQLHPQRVDFPTGDCEIGSGRFQFRTRLEQLVFLLAKPTFQ